MSLRILNSSLSRTGLSVATGAFTISAWMKITTDGTQYQPLLGLINTLDSDAYVYLDWARGASGAAMTLGTYGAGADGETDFGTRPASGTWFHVFVACSSNGANGLRCGWARHDDVFHTTVTRLLAAATATKVYFGYYGFGAGYGSDLEVANLRIWDAELSAEAIAWERYSNVAVRRTNLLFDVPCFDGTVALADNDFSGQGRDLTSGGGVSVGVTHSPITDLINSLTWALNQIDVTLAIADAAHAHSAGAPALTEISLLVSDAAHAHAAGAPVLTELSLLAGDGAHAHTAENAALVQQNTLVSDNAAHAHTAGAPTLVEISLFASDAVHAHTAENAALTQQNTLVAADAAHAHTAENAALTQQNTLVADSAAHAHTAENAALTQQNTLVADSTAHAHTAGVATLLDILVVGANAAHGHTAENTVLIELGLALQDAAHGHTVGSVALTQQHTLAVDNTAHVHAAGVPTLAELSLLAGDAAHAHTAENAALTQQHTLAAGSAAHAHTAENAALTQQHTLAAGSAVHAHLAETPALTEISLTTGNTVHAHTAGTLVIAEIGLSAAETVHAHAAETLTLSDLLLITDNAIHAHAADSFEVIEEIVALGDDSYIGQTAGAVVLFAVDHAETIELRDFVFRNNASTFLAVDIDEDDTTILVVDGDVLPDPTSPSQIATLLLQDKRLGTYEIMNAVSRDGDQLVVERGAEDTLPAAFGAGLPVTNALTAAFFRQFTQRAYNPTPPGPPTGGTFVFTAGSIPGSGNGGAVHGYNDFAFATYVSDQYNPGGTYIFGSVAGYDEGVAVVSRPGAGTIFEVRLRVLIADLRENPRTAYFTSFYIADHISALLADDATFAAYTDGGYYVLQWKWEVVGIHDLVIGTTYDAVFDAAFVVSRANHAHTAERPTLTVLAGLVMPSVGHTHTAENVVLNDLGLIPSNAVHAHAAENTVLGNLVLLLGSAAHAHDAGSPTLTLPLETLTVANAAHAHAAGTLSLTDWLAIASSTSHAHTVENVVLNNLGLLPANALHAHTAGVATLTDLLILVGDAAHAHAAGVPTLTVGLVTLTVANTAHAHAVEVPTLTLGLITLAAANATHAHAAEAPALTQAGTLVAANTAHAHAAGVVTITTSDSVAPTIPMALTAIVSSSSLIVVSCDVPMDIRTPAVGPSPVQVEIERKVGAGAYSLVTTLPVSPVTNFDLDFSLVQVGTVTPCTVAPRTGADIVMSGVVDGVMGSTSDAFNFYCANVGDIPVGARFSLTLPVYSSGYEWSTGGIMISDGLTPTAKRIYVLRRPDAAAHGTTVLSRATAGGSLAYTGDITLLGGAINVILERASSTSWRVYLYDATAGVLHDLAAEGVLTPHTLSIGTSGVYFGTYLSREVVGAAISATFTNVAANMRGRVIYNDTNVSAGNTYTYRARGKDG